MCEGVRHRGKTCPGGLQRAELVLKVAWGQLVVYQLCPTKYQEVNRCSRKERSRGISKDIYIF